nr:hypothetical protein [Tanacetum cinerariifolium]
MMVQNQSQLDEAIHKKLGDSLVRVATIASSLKAEQYNVPRNHRGTTAQTRVLDLEKTTTTQRNEIASLKRRVKKLEKKNRLRTHRLKRLYKVSLMSSVESSGNEESLGKDASKQERIDAIDADEEITLVSVQDKVVSNDADKEMFNVDVLDDSVAGDIVSIASVATIVSAATTTTATIATVGDINLAQALKEIKSTKPKEKKIVIQELDQIRLDEEAALKLQAAFDEEERLAREKAKKVEEANIDLIETWDDIQAKIDSDYQLAKRMQAQEQEVTAEKAKKCVRLIMEKLFGMELEFMLVTQSLVIPTDPHHTPTIIPPSTKPQKKQQPRKPKRKDTQVPQPSDPIKNVPDEAVHKELGDSLVRAVTTASSLEAEQDNGNINKTQSKVTPNESSSQGPNSGGGPWCQETMRGTTAQTRFESVSKHFNDSLLAKESLGEDASKQERIDAIDADEEITMVSVQDEVVSNDVDKEMFFMDVLNGEDVLVVEHEVVVKGVNDEVNFVEEVVEVINIAKLIIDDDQDSATGDIVSTASAATTVSAATITTVGDITLAQALKEIKSIKPKEKGIVIQELGKSTTTKSSQQSHDKGKGIMIEPVIEPLNPMKRKDQIRLDEEAALKLQAAFDEEERLARDKAKKNKVGGRQKKRAGTELIQEITKKQKVEDDKETTELKQFMEIIPDKEEVAIDAIPLSVKSLKIVN